MCLLVDLVPPDRSRGSGIVRTESHQKGAEERPAGGMPRGDHRQAARSCGGSCGAKSSESCSQPTASRVAHRSVGHRERQRATPCGRPRSNLDARRAGPTGGDEDACGAWKVLPELMPEWAPYQPAGRGLQWPAVHGCGSTHESRRPRQGCQVSLHAGARSQTRTRSAGCRTWRSRRRRRAGPGRSRTGSPRSTTPRWCSKSECRTDEAAAYTEELTGPGHRGRNLLSFHAVHFNCEPQPCGFIALHHRTRGAIEEPGGAAVMRLARRSGTCHSASPVAGLRYPASFAASLTSCEPITLRWIWFVPS